MLRREGEMMRVEKGAACDAWEPSDMPPKAENGGVCSPSGEACVVEHEVVG